MSAEEQTSHRDQEDNAERTLRHMKKDRNFWIVDGKDSNILDLSEVLEVRYNKDCKDCYSATIVDTQNYSRLAIKCNVCNSELSSYDPFTSHNNGKNHKKAVQQFMSSDVKLPNLLGPIVFKNLDKMECEFEQGTLEEQLFSTKNMVLGWQFLYRTIYNGEQLYTCQLCSKRKGNSSNMTQKEAFNHMVDESHLRQYMDVAFHKRGTYEQLYPEIEKNREREGKIQHNILTVKSDLDRAGTSSDSWSRQHHSSSSSRLQNRKWSQDRKGPGRPMTPPSPEKFEMASQTDQPEQTETGFMEDIARHYNTMSKTGDDLTEELKKDVEAQDLLIQTIKVLSQKVYLYSMTSGTDHKFQANAAGLLKKTDHLKLLGEEDGSVFE